MSAALYPQPSSDELYDQISHARWPATPPVRSAPPISAVPPLTEVEYEATSAVPPVTEVEYEVTSAVPPVTEVEYVATHGPWHFTRQATMDAQLIAEFYDLYRLAFTPLKKRSVARQVLTELEFIDQMLNERVVKYVARSETGEALGLTTLTNELESVPWISPDYFAEHYPQHWARNAVYYLGFTLAHPSQRHLRFVETIIMIGMQSLALEHAVIAYDVCAFNNLELKFNDRVAGALGNFPAAKFELVDTQSYSCVTFN